MSCSCIHITDNDQAAFTCNHLERRPIHDGNLFTNKDRTVYKITADT